ncbi:acyl-CoA dehydrogenase family protein [Mycobacterium sp. URHD0025]|uniref:acyl-CoA dehydrogenase family protein n=1 Tax=Mycobacterium sp. URHD0025 TaxID=1298864 RepID=UPI000422624C|nr:acyl-CoA dehydrogenase family protein [Mycobacterium sp. URHD0025]
MTSAADELRQAVREFLAATTPSEVVRRLMDTDVGYDETTLRRMASELGLHSIAVPEQFGGAGATTAELAVVFEEMGAALVCAPFFATVALAIPAILTSGDEQAAADLIPRLVDGTDTATLVLNSRLGPWDPTAVALTAHDEGGAYTIRGSAPMVLDGHTAAIVLVAAHDSTGTSLFAVAGDAEGLTRTPLAGMDRTRKIAHLDFHGAPARLIGRPGAAEHGLALCSDIATVLLAAEQLGGAARCLDTAVGYAKDRIQFGRPIGSFQAVKHRCADMLVEVEGARSAVVHAAATTTPGELAIAASVAKLAASEAFMHVAFDNMRIHGGLGFTWEHDAHLYMRRAKASALMFGDADHHASRLADLVTSIPV